MNMSYVKFLIRSADCPSIDYDSKKEKKDKEEIRPRTAEEEIAAITAALG